MGVQTVDQVILAPGMAEIGFSMTLCSAIPALKIGRMVRSSAGYRLKMRVLLATVLLWVGLLVLPCQAQAEYMSYKGYLIDTSGWSGGLEGDAMARLRGQIDIVEQVGLPASVVVFFKSRPLVLDHSLRQPGEDMNGRLVINPMLVDNIHPVALHEYLHALHFERLGLRNPEIRAAYGRAMSQGFYPGKYRNAHFLENEKEYFAVLGTIYLFGNIQQPPFNCQISKERDPAFIAFLAGVFGVHHGCD